MKILELCKNYCHDQYNGNYRRMIEEEDGIIFDDEKIRLAFNRGNGTEKDFRRFMKRNAKRFRYYDMDARAFIF